TVHFDPAVLTMSDIAGANVNPDVILGSTLPEGTRVIVNTSSIAEGDLGIVLDFNGSGNYPAITAEAGTRMLVVLRFTIADTAQAGTSSPVTFGDGVFMTKMADTLGRSVAVDGGLQGGSVIIEP